MWLQRSIGGFTVGLLLVYFSFFAIVVPAVLAARFHFSDGYWALGIWSLASMVMVPKAVLGIVLLIGRKSGVWLSMSYLVCNLYPRTIAKHQDERSTLGMPGLGTPLWRA